MTTESSVPVAAVRQLKWRFWCYWQPHWQNVLQKRRGQTKLKLIAAASQHGELAWLPLLSKAVQSSQQKQPFSGWKLAWTGWEYQTLCCIPKLSAKNMSTFIFAAFKNKCPLLRTNAFKNKCGLGWRGTRRRCRPSHWQGTRNRSQPGHQRETRSRCSVICYSAACIEPLAKLIRQNKDMKGIKD